MTREFNGIRLDCYRADGEQDDFWATRDQIGRLLEYGNPDTAIKNIHIRNADRLDSFSTQLKLSQVEGNRTVTRDVIVYNFKGLLEICRYSNQPKANAVMDFLWNVADEIRRTGAYRPAQADVRLFDVELSMTERVLRAAGIKDNQLAIALDQATQSLVGISPLAISGTALEAPTKRQVLNPTEIGEQVGLSAREVNNLLAEAGFQYRVGSKWEPLEPGLPYAVMMDVGKKQSSGTPIRQLKWESSIIEEVRKMMANEQSEE